MLNGKDTGTVEWGNAQATCNRTCVLCCPDKRGGCMSCGFNQATIDKVSLDGSVLTDKSQWSLMSPGQMNHVPELGPGSGSMRSFLSEVALDLSEVALESYHATRTGKFQRIIWTTPVFDQSANDRFIKSALSLDTSRSVTNASVNFPPRTHLASCPFGCLDVLY